MIATATRLLARSIAAGAATALFAECADGPAAPTATEQAVATLRAATDRYHDLRVALADGFVLLHGCETRGDEGPVGTVYVHMARVGDGKVDPTAPDALIYEPHGTGAPTLVGVEFAVPNVG